MLKRNPKEYVSPLLVVIQLKTSTLQSLQIKVFYFQMFLVICTQHLLSFSPKLCRPLFVCPCVPSIFSPNYVLKPCTSKYIFIDKQHLGLGSLSPPSWKIFQTENDKGIEYARAIKIHSGNFYNHFSHLCRPKEISISPKADQKHIKQEIHEFRGCSKISRQVFNIRTLTFGLKGSYYHTRSVASSQLMTFSPKPKQILLILFMKVVHHISKFTRRFFRKI